MDNQLKPLLLNIAALPIRDQRWLIKQLTPKHKRVFSHYKGTSILYEARRFAGLNLANQTQKPCLPPLCGELKMLPPLYVAIILEQGQFPWAIDFVEEYQQHHNLPSLPIKLVEKVKLGTKVVLFNQWQKTLNFAGQLEVDHGPSI